MNWTSELYDLYEKNRQLAGKIEYKIYHSKNNETRIPYVLLPIFHTTVAAQIMVAISEDGDFLRAEKVGEDDKTTIIPVTEKSGSRTAGVEPHPLCDNLKYLGGDYSRYYANKKQKDYGKNYQLYIDGLKEWSESANTHHKVKAISQYLQKASLIQDLVNAGILKLDENGMLDESVKIQNVSQADAFVRFQVEGVLQPGENIFGEGAISYCPQCWLDESLYHSYIEYYRSTFMDKDLCYLTGEETQISYLQPKKIRNEGDGAKLISSNDSYNFTYRGRFCDRTEAFAVGFEASQKVHNALKWIIRRQGCNWDGMYTVVWESDLRPIPEWNRDTDDIWEEYQEESDEWGEDVSAEETGVKEKLYAGTGEYTAAKFKKALLGYQRKMGNTSRVVLLAFDAATTGRLAMTQCQELDTTRYLLNIENWHKSCEWLHIKYKNGARYDFAGMVSVRELAEILYGTEQQGMLSLNGKSRMYAETCKRILPCIWNGKPIPDDMVKLAIKKASSPVSYEKRYNWEKALTLACSLVKKQIWDREKIMNKEEWTMEVDEGCKDRNYLYGRLLAVADKIESRTFDRDEDKGRETNAKRYMCMFSQKPFQTWKVIEEKIQPYLMKLKSGERNKYQLLLDKIFTEFTVETFECNENLNGLYLLGYHSQIYDLRYKPEEDKTENKDKTENEDDK